jgi:hypothetical protein
MIAPDLVADRLPAPQFGVHHFSIGTDMDGILPPSIIFDDYAEWPNDSGTAPGARSPRRRARQGSRR